VRRGLDRTASLQDPADKRILILRSAEGASRRMAKPKISASAILRDAAARLLRMRILEVRTRPSSLVELMRA